MDISSLSSAISPVREVPAIGSSGAAAPAGVAPANEGSMSGVTSATNNGKPVDKVQQTWDLQAALSHANQMIQQKSTSLEFQVDPASKQTVVRMVDITNNQVLKQFPSEEFLRMASVVDSLEKQLVSEKV